MTCALLGLLQLSAIRLLHIQKTGSQAYQDAISIEEKIGEAESGSLEYTGLEAQLAQVKGSETYKKEVDVSDSMYTFLATGLGSVGVGCYFFSVGRRKEQEYAPHMPKPLA